MQGVKARACPEGFFEAGESSYFSWAGTLGTGGFRIGKPTS